MSANWQLATGNWQLATGNWQLATGNWQLTTIPAAILINDPRQSRCPTPHI
jgi:hypothetical protein